MSDDIIAVTGASNGIGAELAKILLEAGKQVIAYDLVEPEIEVSDFIQVDLSDPASISKAITASPTTLNGLCNCAGLPPREGLEQKILAVNFLGTRDLSNGLEVRLSKGSSIVNLASRAGARWRESVDQVKRLAALGWPALDGFITDENIDPVRAYDLSKEAVIVWTMANSERLSNVGLRTNSISPGAIETRILSDFATAFGDRMAKNVARAGRAGTPEEVARLAAFLLSPDSHWIKGTDLSIDGGMSAFMTSDMLSLDALTDRT